MLGRDFNGNRARESQEYSRNSIEYKNTGRYICSIFLLYSCLGFPVKSL